ncbi:probable S-adenosylmethionine mitochondrial carrier protein at C-terminar half [Coccomyxa sp. Obi]|nr:probable S-adenosylmethionine mitochondrial carrier protein at C-terminar half [Coccomyxa sp. Obi]
MHLCSCVSQASSALQSPPAFASLSAPIQTDFGKRKASSQQTADARSGEAHSIEPNSGTPRSQKTSRRRKSNGKRSGSCAARFASASSAAGSGEWKLPSFLQWKQWKPPRMPGFGTPLWVVLAAPGCPDKKQLIEVQDFFKYTEKAGREFFAELDRDGDGRVSVQDMRDLMRKRKLPDTYASQFIAAARGPRWWSNSISWDDFQAYVDEREPKMLRAFTSLEVNPAGQFDVSHIKSTITKLGLSATEDNAKAMMKALGAEEDGFVSYGKFRNFLVLLPEAKLTEVDPSIAWFEAATMVPFGPPAQKDKTGKLLVRAALAGGIASGTTTLMMYPLDTLKTRVQSTAGATIGSIVRSVPDIGLRGLYRGILPAVSGQFVSHGLRTFAYEGSLNVMKAVSGGAAELQMQGLASGVGTVLGTCIRIPCEVLKQRLQVGRHDHVLEALAVATKTEGVRGLFRGTPALLSREVPFYVFGMMGYAQLKRIFDGSAFGGGGRDLPNWEVIAIGGLAGAIASIATTPADVLKTRIMTAAAGETISAGALLASIVQKEGVGALFKGALPRAIWTAPLGAMNFAGYELAKNALNNREKGAAAGTAPPSKDIAQEEGTLDS